MRKKKVPVLLKSETSGINDPHSLGDFSVWNGEKSRSFVASNPTSNLYMGNIRRSRPTTGNCLWQRCGVKNGYTMSEVHGEIREEIEKMNLPQGYSFFWDSQ